MKKSDLKTGMRVVLRCGGIYIVLKDCDTRTYGHQDILLCEKRGYMCGSDYNEDMIFPGDNRWDIVRVYQSDSDDHYCDSDTLDFDVPFRCIWERTGAKEGLQVELDKLKASQANIAKRIVILEEKLR